MLTRGQFTIGGLLIAGVLMLGGCVMNGATTRGGVAVYGDRAYASIMFSDSDRMLIRRYYREHLPPGLAKREHLPPGLRKQLVRHGTLPPGLDGQYLPLDLDRHLSRLPSGYVRLRIATDVLLLDGRTRLILDTVQDIGR